jgi:hypothetical protein
MINQPELAVGTSSMGFPSVPSWYHGDFCIQDISLPDEILMSRCKVVGLSWAAVLATSNASDVAVQQQASIVPRKLAGVNETATDFVLLKGSLTPIINSEGKVVDLAAIAAEQTDASRRQSALTLKNVTEEGGLSFAAGPFASPENPLKQFFTRRGYWRNEDCRLDKLHGIKIWNGKTLDAQPDEFYEGRSRWIEQLLDGRHLFLIAGSDVHCSSIREASTMSIPKNQSDWPSAFGTLRTVAYCPNEFTIQSVISALQRGSTFVTEGPFLSFRLENEKGEEVIPGEHIQGHSFRMSVLAKTSSEFGDFDELMAIVGDTNRKCENILLVLFDKMCQGKTVIELDEADILKQFDVKEGYIRWEAETRTNGRTFSAFTNPIWFEKSV